MVKIELIELLNYKDLLWNLVARDLTVRYKRSVLGFLWPMLNPVINTMPLCSQISEHVNARIAGRHHRVLPLAYGLRCSASRCIHLLTNRDSLSEKSNIPRAEVVIDPQGIISLRSNSPASKPQLY